MTGMRQATVGLGLVERTPPDEILRQGVPPVLEAFPENRRTAVIELAHWSYGTVAGLAFSLLPRRLRASRLAGPVYGVLAWGAFEAVLAPALGLGHARRESAGERWALLADHVVFGFIIGAPPETAVAGDPARGEHDDRGGTMAEHDDRADAVWNAFHTAVNMTGEELREWLLTDASGEEAFERPGPGLGVSARGEEVVAVLRKRRTDLTGSDVDLMEQVADHVNRLLAEPRREDAGWRRSLMSVGHDPLRPDSARPDEENLGG
ncbi:DUF3140 domain-containing protein [Nocardiopsis flavescens]